MLLLAVPNGKVLRHDKASHEVKITSGSESRQWSGIERGLEPSQVERFRERRQVGAAAVHRHCFFVCY